KVVSVGGLHILGTERHEARRIDNQLRGRSGRQGDPGFSRFYLSLEDDLMRIFGSDRISGLMNRLGMEEDMPIENKLVSRAIENAQKKVEAHNFDIRKQLLEYDDVMNKQRIEIYSFRREILQEEGLKDRIYYMAEETAAEMLNIYCPEEKHPEEWDMKGLHDAAYGTFSITYSTASKSPEEIRASLISAIKESYEKKEAEIGSEMMRYIEKTIMLEVVDAQWKDHLLAMDHLKEGIGLRGYGQRDPLTEYKKEAFEVFVAMTDRVSTEVLNRIFKIQVRKEEGLREIHKKQQLIYNKNETAEMQQPVRKGKKTGRNDPCPCGSGKKYKKCCGANA
ncbi:MAG: preprotein translocase subunit SecA, partial [Nitrospirae bacterium CG22_combo_CG10-13_8_21_14_all_44_11]